MTVVELLPVQQFDPHEGNYWGYMTLNFFAPHQAYAAGDPLDEFRDLVRAMHGAGIEVWLDVVYNHSSEFDATGPTYTYRGLDNRTYYLMGPGPGHVPQRHRLREHPALRPPRRARPDHGQPAPLDGDDAGRRLPLRPGLDLHPRQQRRPSTWTTRP